MTEQTEILTIGELVFKLQTVMKYMTKNFQMFKGERAKKPFIHFENDEKAMMETPWFLMSATVSDIKPYYVVMFKAGISNIIVAETIRFLCVYLTPDEFVIGQEYFVDRENEVHMGHEAQEAYEENFMEYFGKVRCPRCENFYFINMIDNNGFCADCAEILNSSSKWS